MQMQTTTPRLSKVSQKTVTQTVDVSSWVGDHEIVLDQEGQEVKITGRWKLDSRSPTENNNTTRLALRIVHKAPNTTATTTLKGVVGEQNQLEIHGTIVVEKQAKNTQSFLNLRVMLLDSSSHAEVVPNLEIMTDEVKCSHAATIAPPPWEQIWYLQSRGLSLKTAQELIQTAFLA